MPSEEATAKTSTYGRLMASLQALLELSKIGSKRDEMVKRTAQMLRWCRDQLSEMELQRDMLTSTWAEKDDDSGEIKVVKDDKGRQSIVFRNEPEFNLAMNNLMREQVPLEGMPEPFTWSDLQKFVKMPDPDTCARLGPFATLED